MAISNKAAKLIKKGLSDRIRTKDTEMVHGVPLYRAPSTPKPATLKPTYDRKTKKLNFR